MNFLPIDRALIIYGALANRSETKGARERLSAHLMKMYVEGEKDEHDGVFHESTPCSTRRRPRIQRSSS